MLEFDVNMVKHGFYRKNLLVFRVIAFIILITFPIFVTIALWIREFDNITEEFSYIIKAVFGKYINKEEN